MRNSLVLILVLLAVPAWAADKGRVAALHGTLTINGKPAKAGTPVAEGDALATGVTTTVDVVMESGVRFRLYDKTKLTIPGDSRSSPFKLWVGRILSIVTPGRPFSVAGLTAVAGVRGTTFFVESQPEKRTYICICKGKLHLSGIDGKDQGEVASEHHAAVTVDNASREKSGMFGHTDKDIDELAAAK